jgi:hypothetical protein
MNTRDIPRSHWPAFIDQFSRTHRAWLATIETNRPTPDRVDPVAHPLRSIAAFVHNGRVVHIDIRLQDDMDTYDLLRVHAPVSVRVDETTEGIAQTLEIVDDRGISTWLRFRSAPRPDMLDGVAPGELSRSPPGRTDTSHGRPASAVT